MTTLYIVKQKSEKILNKRNVKTTKQSHAYRGYASTYNAEILNSFNPGLQPKDTESEIENKLTNSLSKLRGF